MEFSAGIYAALEKQDGATVVAAQWRSREFDSENLKKP